MEMPKEFSGSKSVPFKTVDKLIEEGSRLPEVEKLNWEKGQGKRQTAFLCYSSGTSGLPVYTKLIFHWELYYSTFTNNIHLERCNDQSPKCH
jgi:hypothetical protein